MTNEEQAAARLKVAALANEIAALGSEIDAKKKAQNEKRIEQRGLKRLLRAAEKK